MIEEKIIKLQNEIRNFKTSQTIGQSNSTNFLITSGSILNVTTGTYGYWEGELLFQSGGQAFPHVSILIEDASVSSGTVTVTPFYGPTFYWEVIEPEDLYQDRMFFTIKTSVGSQSASIRSSIYADTPGTSTIERLMAP